MRALGDRSQRVIDLAHRMLAGDPAARPDAASAAAALRGMLGA
jgi:hypothetical protein